MEPSTHTLNRACWIVRIAFGSVFLVNLHCAVQFVFIPETFLAAYELTGTPGKVAVQGIGVAFLMWNATYPLFIADPKRSRILGAIILAQQILGLAGETWILISLDPLYETLMSSIERFIVFDAAGLAIMLFSYLLLIRALKNTTCPPRKTTY